MIDIIFFHLKRFIERLPTVGLAVPKHLCSRVDALVGLKGFGLEAPR